MLTHSYLQRDVKPANVLVRLGDGPPRASLCDFGICKELRSAMSISMTTVGSPHYMGTKMTAAALLSDRACYEPAPELILGGRGADFKVDVYSLGACAVDVSAHTCTDAVAARCDFVADGHR